MPRSIDRARVETFHAAERQRFVAARPRSMELWARARRSMPNGVPMSWMAGLYAHPPLFVAAGEGAYFTDVDGHRYLDMNHADLSMSCGFAPPPVVEAVRRQVGRGSQFLLPTEDAIAVSELLAERFGLPRWQYTLAASSANTEAIRLARAATGRERVVMFGGGYHGHIDDTLHPAEAGQERSGPAGRAVSLPFNDLETVRRVLEAGDVACVIVEPALTNINVVMPQAGFHAGLRALTRAAGAVLIVDETHTHVCAYGGLTTEWGLSPDILVLGKSIAGGIPLGVYGLGEEMGRAMESRLELDCWPAPGRPGLATGGTLFGNPLSMAAARATLERILTPEAQARAARLGAALADGIDKVVRDAGLPWTAHRLYCRSGVCYAPTLPINAAEAATAADYELNRLHRIFLANRGVWEAIVSAGPAVSFAAGPQEIDIYLEVFRDLVRSMTA
jgi:glutamate-1-semialdehyde 2,1-aminomutase